MLEYNNDITELEVQLFKNDFFKQYGKDPTETQTQHWIDGVSYIKLCEKG